MANADVFRIELPCPAASVAFAFKARSGLDYIAGRVLQAGLAAYETPTPAVIAALARGAPGAVLDVGANTGLFSLLAAAAATAAGDAPGTEIHAFEPLMHIRQALLANVEENPRLAPGIRVHGVALSDRTGAAAFYETINDRGLLTTSSSLEASHVRMIGGECHRREVPTVRLDDWSGENLGGLRIKLMKIDVEAHEPAVLAGGMRTIAAHRPMIVLEVLPGSDHGALDRFRDELRYVDFAMTPAALRQSLGFRYHPGGDNHLLCPEERCHEALCLARESGLTIEFA
jgi:FkbM family methyltransferase